MKTPSTEWHQSAGPTVKRARAAVLPLVLSLWLSGSLTAADAVEYAARDTLQIKADDSADAQKALESLTWKPGEFTVKVEAQDEGPHAYVRFPSAISTGDEINDSVAMEWYAPKTADGRLAKVPAVVVVHESGARMEVGRLFAKAIYAKGFHAFMIQLPYYGLRRQGRKLDLSDGSKFLPVMRQSIADVRRARDAVAAIPEVDASQISLQGTSLGGFISATTAGLDHGFNQVFIMLAGGDLLTVINGGRREAAELRDRLAKAGYEGDKLRELISVIEPTALAHRVDPKRVWLYTAKDDQVVPLASAMAYQRAAKMDDDHHIQLWGDHYKVVVYFPVIVDHMTGLLKTNGDANSASTESTESEK